MKQRFLIGIGWTSVGAGVYAASQWGILVVLANVGDVADVGILSISMAVAGPIFLLFGLNLRVAQATDAQGDFDFREYFFVRVVTTGVACLVLLIAAGAWSQIRPYWLAVTLVGFAKAIESLTEVVIGRLQFLERLDQIGKMQVVRGLAGLVAFSITIAATGRLEFALTAWAVAWLLLLLALRGWLLESDASVVTASARSAPLAVRCWALAVGAAPLGVVALMDSLIVNFPKYVLQAGFGVEQVGAFSAIAYLMAIGGVAVGAVGYAVTPRFAKLGLRQQREFVVLMAQALALAAVLGVSGIIVAMFFGARVLEIVYTAEFSPYHQTFVVVMGAATLWYLSGLLGCGLNGLRLFGAHAVVQCIALIAVIVASAILVPNLGAYGAAWAMAIGMGVRLFGAAVTIYWAFRRPVVA